MLSSFSDRLRNREIPEASDSIALGARGGITEQRRFSFLVVRPKGCREINARVASDTMDSMVARFARDVRSQSPDSLPT